MIKHNQLPILTDKKIDRIIKVLKVVVAVAGLEPATSCFLHLPLKGRALPTEPHGENVTPTCLRHPAVLPRRSVGVV